jgi:hypothetical protein
MTPEKALRHFQFKLTTSWKPTAFDLEAYNSLVEFVNEKQKQQLIDNQLFGKLYIYLLDEFTKYYNCSIIDEIPQKELNKILKKPIRSIVNDLVENNNINDIEYYIEKNNSLEGFKPIPYDEVAENLKIMINSCINAYK